MRDGLENKMKIISFGGGERLSFCREYLSDMDGDIKELILLPIPSTKDNIRVKGTDTPLGEVVDMAGEGSAVCGYGLPREMTEALLRKGASVFDGMRSEDFLVENAVLTVDGALGELLTSFSRAPRDLAVGVIGYGRIGKRLLSSLLFLGARVRLYTRCAAVRMTLGEEGIETEEFKPDSDYGGLDVLINTAPCRVLGEQGIRECEKRGLRILDLASGECFPPSSAVKKLASVPEAFYPRSAGALYGKYISEFLRLVKK